MVLNALAIDPKRVWKGPWRWFAEDLLDCCSPLEVVKKEGVTFTQFACLAKCNGATVSPTYASSSYYSSLLPPPLLNTRNLTIALSGQLSSLGEMSLT